MRAALLRPRRPPPLLLPAAAAARLSHRPLPPPPPPRSALRRLLEELRRAPRPPPAPPPGEAALQALLRSPPFCHRRPERFARGLEGWFPREAAALSPATLALVAAFLARHRLRRPPLLDALADALLRAAPPRLHTKVVQRLVLPFGRANYRPSNHAELFPQLEALLVQKAAASPLATVNILMSLAQLQHFPLAALRKVFAPAFLHNATSSPCGLIMRRYLSLLDVAVALEVQEYDGPRLDPRYRVCMFDGALTADEANHKYSFKGLVAEALRQLVGEGGYRQNEVVPPGYCADFLLQASCSGSILLCTSQAVAPPEAPGVQSLAWDALSGSLSNSQGLGSPLTGRPLLPEDSPCPLAPQGCSQREELCPGSSPVGSPCSAAGAALPCCSSPTLGTKPQQHLPKERQELPAAPGASPGAVPGGMEKGEKVHRIVLSVNDKWHYCQSSAVLGGSRAMYHRHLRLLGYHLVQLPYRDLERVSGVEGAKQYLRQKLSRLPVQA